GTQKASRSRRTPPRFYKRWPICCWEPSAKTSRKRQPRGKANMNSKITPEHLNRGAVVYVRQSTITQVMEHTESQRRQYALVEAARAAGFASIETIDDDLGRSGFGLMGRPGFQKLRSSLRGRDRRGLLPRSFATCAQWPRLASPHRSMRSGGYLGSRWRRCL